MLADPSKVLEAETEYNFNDIMLKLFNMCNILDTIIGTLVLNLMVWTLDQSDFTKDSFLRWVIKFIDFSSYLFDIIDMVDIGQGFAAHLDLYNGGKMTGKIVRILIALWLEGFFTAFGDGIKETYNV